MYCEMPAFCTFLLPKYILTASYDGLGTCLSAMRNGEELPDIECLAVVEAVQHFEVYLDGKTFTLKTDHRVFEHLFAAKLQNKHLSR